MNSYKSNKTPNINVQMLALHQKEKCGEGFRKEKIANTVMIPCESKNLSQAFILLITKSLRLISS